MLIGGLEVAARHSVGQVADLRDQLGAEPHPVLPRPGLPQVHQVHLQIDQLAVHLRRGPPHGGIAGEPGECLELDPG